MYGWGSRNTTAQGEYPNNIREACKVHLICWVCGYHLPELQPLKRYDWLQAWIKWYLWSHSCWRYNPMTITLEGCRLQMFGLVLGPCIHAWQAICTSASVNWAQTIGDEPPIRGVDAFDDQLFKLTYCNKIIHSDIGNSEYPSRFLACCWSQHWFVVLRITIAI